MSAYLQPQDLSTLPVAPEIQSQAALWGTTVSFLGALAFALVLMSMGFGKGPCPSLCPYV